MNRMELQVMLEQKNTSMEDPDFKSIKFHTTNPNYKDLQDICTLLDIWTVEPNSFPYRTPAGPCLTISSPGTHFNYPSNRFTNLSSKVTYNFVILTQCHHLFWCHLWSNLILAHLNHLSPVLCSSTVKEGLHSQNIQFESICIYNA